MNKLLKKIKTIPKSYFTYTDIKKISSLNNASLRVALARLVKNQELTRLCQGYYSADAAKVNYEQLACEIYSPSYLSLEWILARVGILSQQPIHLTLVTSNRTKKITIGATQIRYQHIKPELWWGYKQQDNSLVATPEKAIIDLTYLSLNGCATKPIYDEMNLNLLNKTTIKKYLKTIKNTNPRVWKLISAIIPTSPPNTSRSR